MQTNLDNTNFNHDGKILDGEALKNRESELNKALSNKNYAEFNRLGGQSELDNIVKKLKHVRNKINLNKKLTTDTDPRNTYQQELDPTAVKSAKVSKGSNHGGGEEKILKNSQLNENLEKEISEIRYLIEYMTNNNNKLI